MDRQDWMILRGLIDAAVRAVGPSRRVVFSDRLILTMYLWAVAHGQPMCWACERQHYHTFLRPRRLPSVSQFCRRVAGERFQLYLQHLHDATTGHRRLNGLNFLDGKPLAVGNFSRDPDAKVGYGVGRVERGYKLHAVVTEDRKIVAWSVLPLDVHEMAVVGTILQEAVAVPDAAVFMADGNYDAAKLHKAVDGLGGRLYVRPRGKAKHPVTRRQMGPARRALIDAWERAPEACEWVYRQRLKVESTFSALCTAGGGLGPLPGFVRRLARVRRWVGAKVLLYHLRLARQRSRAA